MVKILPKDIFISMLTTNSTESKGMTVQLPANAHLILPEA
jgi:hypothetical protein